MSNNLGWYTYLHHHAPKKEYNAPHNIWLIQYYRNIHKFGIRELHLQE
jgi:hypothetical protein